MNIISQEAERRISVNFLSAKKNQEEKMIFLEKELFKKEHMNEIDRLNMQKALESLQENDIYTLENIQKLYDNVSYAPDAIIIDNIHFSRVELVPQY
jgi:uncharacterized protein YydD (DUF2326 family)